MIFLRCKENVYQISDATAQDCQKIDMLKISLCLYKPWSVAKIKSLSRNHESNE